jgi:hypothetical protein
MPKAVLPITEFRMIVVVERFHAHHQVVLQTDLNKMGLNQSTKIYEAIINK